MRDELKYYENESFYPFLKRLEQTKAILKKYSLSILFTLLISIISMTVFAFSHKYAVNNKLFFDFYTELEIPFLILTFIMIIFGVFQIFRFSIYRDKGMILYEEITDEIDWSRKRKEFIHRPPIELRIIIKEFLKATDLPFTSGKNGQGIYIFLFLLIGISTILIKILI